MQSYPLELLQSMLETYSPSGYEGGIANVLGEHMASNGFKVRKDSAGNVVGEVGEAGPRILLCGHLDTVPGQVSVRKEGDLLYGRGAIDAKSSLAAMLFGAIEARKRTNEPFHLALSCVVEEERSSAGIKALIAEDKPYDFAVFGEPSGVSNIVIGYKGSLLLEITLLTPGGHSASPWVSRNSFEEASQFWTSLKRSVLDNESASKFDAVTGCVTSAMAGEASNVIPTKCMLELDVRVPPSTRTEQLVGRVKDLAAEYQAANHGVRVHIEVKDRTEAFVGMRDSAIVSAFRWAIRKTTDKPFSLVKKTGTSDINLFAQKYAIPMIAYGPGDSSFDHTENEHISIKEYLSSIEVYANAIPKLASLARNPTVAPAALQ